MSTRPAKTFWLNDIFALSARRSSFLARSAPAMNLPYNIHLNEILQYITSFFLWNVTHCTVFNVALDKQTEICFARPFSPVPAHAGQFHTIEPYPDPHHYAMQWSKSIVLSKTIIILRTNDGIQLSYLLFHTWCPTPERRAPCSQSRRWFERIHTSCTIGGCCSCYHIDDNTTRGKDSLCQNGVATS